MVCVYSWHIPIALCGVLFICSRVRQNLSSDKLTTPHFLVFNNAPRGVWRQLNHSIQMKKFYKLIVATLCVATLGLCMPQQALATAQEAQTEEVVAADADNSVVVEETTKRSFGDVMSEILTLLAILLVIAAIIAWIGHMIYERFFRKPMPTYTIEDFQRLRTEQGLPADASNEEIDKASALLSGAKEGWKYDNEYDIDWIPTKKVYKHTTNTIKEVIALKPTTTATVEALNELIDEMNYMNKRTSDLSKPLLWTVIIVSVLMCVIAGGGGLFAMICSFGLNIGVYLLACQAPNWLALKREEKGRGKASSGIIAGMLGMIAGAKTYKTVTKWSDGTTTTDVDNSETGMALIISIVVFVFLTFFLWAIAIWNYLRNYVLYF